MPACARFGRRRRRPAQRRLRGRRGARRRLVARRAVPAHVRHRRRCVLADLRRGRAQGVLPRRRRPRGRRRHAGALRRPKRNPVPRSRAGDADHARRGGELLRGARALRPAAFRALLSGRDPLRGRGFPGQRARWRAGSSRRRPRWMPRQRPSFSPRKTRTDPAKHSPGGNLAGDRDAGTCRLLRGRRGEKLGSWAVSSPSATSPRRARIGAGRSAAIIAASPSARRRRRRRGSPCSKTPNLIEPLELGAFLGPDHA